MTSHEQRFHQNVLGFAALLIDINDSCHERGYGIIDKGILRVAEVALKSFSPTTVIKSFCQHSRPLWDKIRQRDEPSLKASLKSIFQNLPVDLSSQIINLIEAKDRAGNRVISDQDLADIWAYLDSLVKIGLKWLYQQQPDDDLVQEASRWQVKL